MIHNFSPAPWTALLKGLSVFSTLILIGVSYGASRVIPLQTAAHLTGLFVAIVPLTVLVGALLFVVRGYELDTRELRIQRLLWQTHIPLTGLQRVAAVPDLLKGSMRVAGNGGMYSFSGWFYRRDVGRYRAFITDWKMTLVLTIDGKSVAISPADTAGFLHTLNLLYPGLKSA